MYMKTLILFDVDGTLTEPRKIIQDDMIFELKEVLKKKVDLGIVGGSDIIKQKEQLNDNIKLFKWIFSENGLLSFCDNNEINRQNIKDFLGETNLNNLLNIVLFELSKTDNPVKRGTFIEYRNGMINVSPIGRNCSLEERDTFFVADQKYKWREDLIKRIKDKWNNYKWYNNLNKLPNLNFSIGGQISFDIFPDGWDKTYCLNFVKDKYERIIFFGDKTGIGGNDYEIYNHKLVEGYSVSSPKNTINLLKKLQIN